MEEKKPTALFLFDTSFFLFTLISISLQMSNLSSNPQAILALSAFTVIANILLWYFSSRRGALWGKIIIFLLLGLNSFFIIKMMTLFWHDGIRVAILGVLLVLILISIGSLLHPSLKLWQERQRRGDTEIFE